MKTRVIILILAVILAVIGTALIYVYLNSLKVNYEEKYEMRKVVVASQFIQAGTPLDTAVSQEKVELKDVPAEFIAEDAITDIASLSGKVLKVNVSKGMQITSAMLETSVSASLGFMVPSGKRAIAVEVDDVTGVGGKVRAGDRVDIIASFKTGSSPKLEEPVARVFLQNVEVLGSSAPAAEEEKEGVVNTQNSTSRRVVLVLAVPLTDAEKVVLASENGNIWLALRPKGEDRIEQTKGQTVSGLVR